MKSANLGRYDAYKKLLPSLAIQFLLVLSYIFLQEIKVKGLVETGVYNSLATAHLWGGLPLSILFVMIYFKVVNCFERRHHLTLFLIPFSAFFLLYAYVLAPHYGDFHMGSEKVKMLLEKYPGFPGMIHMYAHWATSFFMILIDIWSNFVVGVLFWQFMNDTNSIKEARISYPILGFCFTLFCSIALVINSLLVRQAITYDVYLPRAITLVVGFWAMILVIQYHFHKNASSKNKESKMISKEKLRLSMMETFGYVFTSRYLSYLAIMVLTFGMMLNLLDRSVLFYKGLLLQTHLDHLDMPKISLVVSFLAFCTSALMTIISIRMLEKKNGWFKTARMAPILIGCIALLLLGSAMIKHTETSAGYLFFMTSFVVILVKQIKPFFFKPVKEMAYIPLEKRASG